MPKRKVPTFAVQKGVVKHLILGKLQQQMHNRIISATAKNDAIYATQAIQKLKSDIAELEAQYQKIRTREQMHKWMQQYGVTIKAKWQALRKHEEIDRLAAQQKNVTPAKMEE